MAKLLKLRRGTTSQHSSFTGAEGEVTVDTTKDVLVVHDGSTAGGHPVAAQDMDNVPAGAILGTQLENSGVTAGQYGSSTAIPIVTVDAQGLVTAASTTAIDSTTIANGSSSVSVANNGAITSNANHDFSAGIDVTGQITSTGALTITNESPAINLVDSGNNPDWEVINSNGTFVIKDSTNNQSRLYINSAGTIDVTGNLDVGAGLDVTGNITATGTVDGRDVAADGTKLDGIESGATADQSASEILTLIKTVDGSGSGLDADTLDGVSSASFVRSDSSDTLTGSTYTLSSSTDQKIILSGSNSPYIRWQEGTTNKAYIQWHTQGFFDFVNQETGEYMRIGNGSSGLRFNHDGTDSAVWHSGNDGASSGLDADLLDGQHGSYYSNYNNLSNKPTIPTNNNQLTNGAGYVTSSGYGSGAHASFTSLDVTGSHGIDNESWFRNDDSGDGLYNTATTQHFYSDDDDYWNIAGGGGANALRFRDDHNSTIRGYCYADSNNAIGFLDQGGSWALRVKRSDSTCTLYDMHFRSDTNGSYDLGSSSARWRNVYTSDLDLSNEAKGVNDIDGTWGHYTIVEGESDLFLKNNRSGKTYKFNLTEVS